MFHARRSVGSASDAPVPTALLGVSLTSQAVPPATRLLVPPPAHHILLVARHHQHTPNHRGQGTLRVLAAVEACRPSGTALLLHGAGAPVPCLDFAAAAALSGLDLGGSVLA